MKVLAITALLMVICTLPFSCTNKDNSSSAGAVVIWTNNAAKLSACSSSIIVKINETVYGTYVGLVTVSSLNSTAPDCSVSSKLGELIPGKQYTAQLPACAGSAGFSFSVNPGECFFIQIP